MKKQRTRRQHTVPQFYLRRFCKGGESLFVFDKTTGRKFPARVGDVAVQSYFYDMPADLVRKACPGVDVDLQFVEESFSRMEAWAKPVLDEVAEAADLDRMIPRPLRLQLAPYIILQSLRTGLSRNVLAEMARKFREAAANAYLERRLPEAAKHVRIEVTIDPNILPVLQAGAIFDEDMVVEMAGIINAHIWFVCVNATAQPFYTSDHPVVKMANRKHPGRSFNGLRSPGIEIHFPIDSRHVLVMLERSHFRKMAPLDGKIAVADPSSVKRCNTLQVLKCHKHLFCEEDKFEQAEEIRKENPACCDPDRSRVETVQADDVFGILFND